MTYPDRTTIKTLYSAFGKGGAAPLMNGFTGDMDRGAEGAEQVVGDRAIRTLSGLFLLVMIFLAPDAPLRWFGLVGIIPLLTGLVGTCPFRKFMQNSVCHGKA